MLRFLPEGDKGGYNMMFVMVYLYTALEMMQNGFENFWNWLRKHENAFFWCMMFYFINFVDENDVFGEEFICLRCYLDSK